METIDLINPQSARKPPWLKVQLPSGEAYENVRAHVKRLELNTVCQEAMCPNLGECWGAGTATIMILGDTCTRGCHFCNVKTGSPKGEVDWLEPKRVAEAVAELGWNYLVLTAVDRDDRTPAPVGARPARQVRSIARGARARETER
jgi:lipoic acid synthetase